METQNVLGSYGPWASKNLGNKVGHFSLRNKRFKSVDAWRKAARTRMWELLAAPPLPKVKPRVVARGEHDGAAWEKYEWQLPWGPKTEAVFLKPANAPRGKKLPAILGLHDHGGRKFFGWKKIAEIGEPLHPLMVSHRDDCYGSKSWANEAVKRGYAVLVHDTFLFGSRKVKVADVLAPMGGDVTDPAEDAETDEIAAYNRWAGGHESEVAKSLFCAGTTWPALYLRDDQVALSILCARPDVDARRVACGGLSGGGLRTVFLAGMDDRIRTCFCAGFFSTWRDFMLNKSWTHTWMTYLPLLPRDLDFSEIIGLRAPKPTLVLNCESDPLYTIKEVRIAAKILGDVYKRAKAPEAYRFSLYPGGHVLDEKMQNEAFDWCDRWMA